MDVLWPGRRRDLGTTIYYKCPFRSSTGDDRLNGKRSVTNYVDKFLTFFDHLTPFVDSFYIIKVDMF